MSNLAAIGMVGALLIAATFLMYHITITMNRKDAEIITGFMGDVPLPRSFRWWTLLQIELPIAFFTCGFGVLVAFVFLLVAHNIEDADIAFLAQGCAVLYFGFSAMYLLAGAVAIGNVISGRSKKAIYRPISR